MFRNSLNTTIIRITTRYNSIYPYDVDVVQSFVNGTTSYVFQGGYAVECFLTLQEFLGFEYTFVTSVGPYNFTLAEAHEVDIFVGSYSLYSERAKIVNPTFVMGNSKQVEIIALINHEHEGNTQDIFSLPFSQRLWFGLISMLLISLIIIGIMGWVEKVSFQDSIFHTIAALLQKACKMEYSSIGCRSAFFLLSASTVMIMGCYTGNMFSIKALNRFSINSIGSLVESRYNVLLELGESSSSIKVMLEGLRHIKEVDKLLTRIHNSKYEYTTFEHATNEVAKHATAYILDEETAMTTVAKEMGQFPCSWSALSVLNLKYPWTMYMRKNSSLRPAINYGLLKIDEIGIRSRLRQKWIPHATKCLVNTLPFATIRINQVHTGFYIYFILLVLCFPFSVWSCLNQNF